jgi:hypothetical protein
MNTRTIIQVGIGIGIGTVIGPWILRKMGR